MKDTYSETFVATTVLDSIPTEMHSTEWDATYNFIYENEIEREENMRIKKFVETTIAWLVYALIVSLVTWGIVTAWRHIIPN